MDDFKPHPRKDSGSLYGSWEVPALNSPGVEVPERALRSIGLVVFAIVVSLALTEVQGQSWSSREQDNAISRHGAFMVILQPGEGFCYVKQSYHDDTSKMELTFKGASPIILTPFFSGLDGDVQYWVDDSPKRTVRNSTIGRGSSFELAVDIVGEMKSGRTLHIRVKPRGRQARTQRFSLLGFAAAARVLADRKCQDTGSEAIGADMTDSFTPGAIIYVRSPIALKPFPDEDSLGFEEVKSGLQLMYIQKQNGWLEIRAIGTGGKSGWIPESALSGKTSGVVVTAIENDAYRGFIKGFWEYSRSLERPGFKPFTEVAFMGDGIIKVIATDDWLAQPRPDRDRDVGSIYQLWTVADGTGSPTAVYVYDQAGQVRFRQD